MNTICIDPQTDPLWQKLIDQHSSDVFHSPQWMQVLVDTYDFDIGAWVLLDDAGNPVAGIPFCRIEDVRGKRIVTLPFSDYCDPLVDDHDQWHHLTNQLLAEQSSFAIRCLHNNIPLADDQFALVNKAKWHGLDLQPDLDMLWQGFDSSARRAIKKAQRNDIEVRIAQSEEELRAFFELHLKVRKYKYRLLAQPYCFFERIWHRLIEQQKGMVMIALFQDEIIGGVLFLEWKERLYYKFNTSNPDYISYRPNDMVIWEGIKYGRAKGYTYLDFGLSDWDQEGLVRYKRKFATEEKTISFLRYTNNEQPSAEAKQLGNLFPQLTQLFTDDSVSDHITEKAGELLYKFFT